MIQFSGGRAPFLIGSIGIDVSVQQVGCDAEGVVAVGRPLVFLRSRNADAMLAHQPTDTTMPHAQAKRLQFFGHARTAIAAQTETRLFLDVRQDTPVSPVPLTGRAAAISAQTTRADIQHVTQTLCAKAWRCSSVTL